MSPNPNLLKPNKQPKQKRQQQSQQSKKQEHQAQSQQAKQSTHSSLIKSEPTTALPTLEEQVDLFVDIVIDIYLQDQQKNPTHETK